MKSLYLRIYATIVLVLLLFAAASGWVFHRHIEQERARAETLFAERMGAQAELIQRSLPGADAASADQAEALREWSERLRLPLALDSSTGERIAASDSFVRRQQEGVARGLAVRLEDGRTLWIMRPGMRRLSGERRGPGSSSGGGGRPGNDEPPLFLPFMPPGLQGIGLVIVLAMVFVAVAAGAYPVVRRLTRRLESLKQGVEQFGAGQLNHRVEVSGQDEVAAVAASFNVAAARVEALVRSHQSLLANASHELRSPLARMKMAVSMLADASPEQGRRLKTEIDTNVAELDALVEEVLLASRLDAAPALGQATVVDLLGIAVEEAARVDAVVSGAGAGVVTAEPAADRSGFPGDVEPSSAGRATSAGPGSPTPGPAAPAAPFSVVGEERLLRRALRNLLENARRYGGGAVSVTLQTRGSAVLVQVCDRGSGVPETMRERIFEPFFRLPGHAEQAGGVGLGLSLVKQIAERHGGSVRCEARPGGGSCFVLELPWAREPAPVG